MSSPDLESLLSQAQRLHRSGDLAGAERDYLRLVERAPGEAQLWHLLGVVAHQRANYDEAVKRFRKAIELRPDLAAAHNNLGLALKASGRVDEAQAAYEAVLERNPQYAEAAYNLALLHEGRGDVERAEAAYRLALESRSEWTQALGNLGNLLRRAGRAEDAAAFLERAVELDPDDRDAIGNLALARIDQGRYAEALALARRAVALDPSSAQWNEAAGSAARLAGDADTALPYLRRAAELAPGDAALWFELALASGECADGDAAQSAYQRALALAPAWEKLRWAEALALPRIVESDAHAAHAVERFHRGLERLHAELRLETPEEREAALDAALATVPFNLHYLPGDHTRLQRRFAELVARSVRASLPQYSAALARKAPGGRRMRVGFVSGYLRTHVVARFFAPFITGLDPREFERWAWFTGEAADDMTRAIAASVEHFEAAKGTLAELAEAIRGARLDALVFLDIGLDPRQLALAALRLAPIQAACYGHPVTSGMDTIDHFLSGEAIETDASQKHYSETLVRLPGLGARPTRPSAPGDGGWAQALRIGNRPLVLCLQNLSKIAPAFDAVLASVLAESGACLVLFDRGAALTAKFLARFDTALRTRGLDPRTAVHVEPLHPYAEFLGGLVVADLVLDTPGFSGGGTSLDALGLGVPVLAFEGTAARSRQTSAMLKRLEVPELIAADDDDYVKRAAGLLRDRDRLASLRARIRERSHRLFDDEAPIASFAAFLRGS